MPAAPKPAKEPKKSRVLIVTSVVTILLFVLLVAFAKPLREADSLEQARYIVLLACAVVFAQIQFLFRKESSAQAGVKKLGVTVKLSGPAAIAGLVVAGSYWLVPRSYPPPPEGIVGYVVHGPDSFEEPVKDVAVGIYGGPAAVTKGSGEFTIEKIVVQNQPKNAGDPVTFNVNGWVIRDPYVGTRGRLFLPKPGSEPIKIRVLRRGDPLFLGGGSIEKILAQRTFEFETGTQQPRRPQRPQASGAKTRQEWDTFLVGPASEIGFPLDQVKNAISRWTLTANTNYRKGLAALYEDNVGQAADYFQEAAKQAPPGDLYVTVASAYTEYRRGNYAESVRLLNQLNPKDPLIQENLQVVSHPEESVPDRHQSAPQQSRPTATPATTPQQIAPANRPKETVSQLGT